MTGHAELKRSARVGDQVSTEKAPLGRLLLVRGLWGIENLPDNVRGASLDRDR